MAIFVAITTFLIGCENEQEKWERIDTERDLCIEKLTKDTTEKCYSACDIEPEETYCAMLYGEQVIGSRCKSEIVNSSQKGDENRYQRYVRVCKENACGDNIRKQVISHCFEKIKY